MLKLNFGNTIRSISTFLIFLFIALFSYGFTQYKTITQWGLPVFLMFVLGLSMSIVSGMRDGMGTPNSLIPIKHRVMTLLSLLGGLAFLVGIIAVFYQQQDFLRTTFFILSGIVIVKVIVTEAFRITHYKNG